MHLSKPIDARSSTHRVLNYEMPTFELGISQVALGAMEDEKKSSSFQLSELVKNKTGVKQLELKNLEIEVEQRVLAKLAEVQEGAYKQAFDLGKLEGKNEAFNRFAEKIDTSLKNLESLVQSIESLKPDLLQANESHLVQLSFEMAQKLAALEISVDPTSTLEIMRQAVEHAQSEEDILIKISPDHLEFFETLKKEKRRELEFMKRTRFEADPDVGIGGCVVTTNYGEIDSRFTERVARLWDTLKDRLVKVKKQLKSVS